MRISQPTLRAAYNQRKDKYIIKGRIYTLFYSQNAGYYIQLSCYYNTGLKKGFYTSKEVNKAAGCDMFI
jgi:hypothetical protein